MKSDRMSISVFNVPNVPVTIQILPKIVVYKPWTFNDCISVNKATIATEFSEVETR